MFYLTPIQLLLSYRHRPHHPNPEVGTMMTLILLRRKMRHRVEGMKLSANGITASKWQSWGWNPINLVVDSILLCSLL